MSNLTLFSNEQLRDLYDAYRILARDSRRNDEVQKYRRKVRETREEIKDRGFDGVKDFRAHLRREEPNKLVFPTLSSAARASNVSPYEIQKDLEEGKIPEAHQNPRNGQWVIPFSGLQELGYHPSTVEAVTR